MIFSKKIRALFTLLISSIILFSIFNPIIDGLHSSVLEILSSSLRFPADPVALNMAANIIVLFIKVFGIILSVGFFYRLYFFMLDENPSQPEYEVVDGSTILRSEK